MSNLTNWHGQDHLLDPLYVVDNTQQNGLHLQAATLLGDPHVMATAMGTPGHLSPKQALEYGLAGFMIADGSGAFVSPEASHAAVQQGNQVASDVLSRSVVTDGDVADALAAYGNIHGGLLNPEGAFAQANLSAAIDSARSKLAIQKLAAGNGSGDDPYAAMTQYSSPEAYQAHIKELNEQKVKETQAA